MHMRLGVAVPALGALPRMSKRGACPVPALPWLARVCARCACVCASVHVPAAVLAPPEERQLFHVVYFWVHEVFKVTGM